MLQSINNIRYGQAVLMLKQAKERIQATSRASRTTKTAMLTQEKALFALDKPKFKLSSQGRDTSLRKGFRRCTSNSKAKGKPTSGNRECWHCSSQTHIKTTCYKWLNTLEGTKQVAKNPKSNPKQGIPSKQIEGAQSARNTLNLSVNPTTQLVDSKATSHITWNRALFTTFKVIEPLI